MSGRLRHLAAAAARRARDERGQTAVEFVGMFPWLLIAALVAWQVLLVGYTSISTGNAARTASRVASLGGDAETAGERALPGMLADGAEVEVDGTRTTVRARVPILVPGLDADAFTVSKTAELPEG